MLITLIKIRKSENTIRFNETGWNHREKCNHKENSDTDCMLVSKDTNEKLGENKLDIFIRRTKESVNKLC